MLTGLAKLKTALILVAVSLVGGTCTFDTTHLNELANPTRPQVNEDASPELGLLDIITDTAPLDTDDANTTPDAVLDLEQPDLNVDGTELPGDITVSDGFSDPTTDPPADPVIDLTLDAQDVAIDAGTDVTVDLTTEEVDPENQPPVLTLPSPPTIEAEASILLSGLNVDDPDAGEELIQLTLSVDNGQLTLSSIPAELVFSVGDGADDATMTFQGPQASINEAVSLVDYQHIALETRSDQLSVEADDLGHSGTGGPQTASGAVLITLTDPTRDITVQRGYTIIETGLQHATINVVTDYDLPSGPSFVRIVNSRLSGMGATHVGATVPIGDQNAEDWMAWISDASNINSSITFSRFGITNRTRVSWEIISYTGVSGGSNEILIHGNGVAVYETDALTCSGDALGGGIGHDDVVVFITGQATPSSSTLYTNTGLSTASWDSSSAMPVFERGDHDNLAAVVSYAVVEFSGSNWSVQRTEHSYSVAGDVENETIDTVGNTNRAFLHTQHRSGEPSLASLGEIAWLSAPNIVSFQLSIQALDPSSIDTVAWVIRNSQTGGSWPFVVSHYSGDLGTGGSVEETLSLVVSEVEALQHASVMGENAYSNGYGTSTPRGSINFLLLNETTVEIKRSDTGQPNSYRFSVVQWPDN